MKATGSGALYSPHQMRVKHNPWLSTTLTVPLASFMARANGISCSGLSPSSVPKSCCRKAYCTHQRIRWLQR